MGAWQAPQLRFLGAQFADPGAEGTQVFEQVLWLLRLYKRDQSLHMQTGKRRTILD
jgi:hypothetical protein